RRARRHRHRPGAARRGPAGREAAHGRRRVGPRPPEREPAVHMTRPNPRHVAFDAIRAVSAEDAYANIALPKLLPATGLEGRDAALATELTYGTLRSLGTLEAILAAASGRDLDRLQADLVDALCLGAYQLLYTRVPVHAAVSTTVGLVKAAVSPRVS